MISRATFTTIAFDPVGIPYGLGLSLDDSARAETLPDHVGGW